MRGRALLPGVPGLPRLPGVRRRAGPLPVLLLGDEHGDGVRGHAHGPGLRVPARALDDLVGAVRLHLVQRVAEPGHVLDLLGERLVGGVEDGDHAVEGGVDVGADGVVDPHHEQARGRLGAGVREGDLLADQLRIAEGEQRRGGAQAQQVQGDLAAARDVLGGGVLGRVLQHRHHQVPGLAVLALGRQAVRVPAVLLGPVDGVEVVAGVVAVAVQGLRAHQVGAAGPEGGRLAQRHGRERERVHPHAHVHGGVLRQLPHVHVVQRLVVVRVDVVHGLLGRRRVPGRRAVVVQLVAAHHLAGRAEQLVVGEVARHPESDQVGAVAQVGQLLGLAHLGVAVRHGGETVAEALGGALVGVEGAAAVDGVAQPVVEGADRGAAELPLRGLGEAGVAGDLAEVPALAVEVDALAVHAVGLEGQLVQRLAHGEHVLAAVMAHEVEAEAVDAVVPRPGHGRVDHQLLRHRVLGGDVRAAGGVLYVACEVQALVVAGDDAVEHRALGLPVRGGVVVHLVEHDLQAHAVQLSHHGAELAGALAADLVALGRVRALGRQVVQRVVAPVVGVLVRDGRDGLLLRGGGGAGVGGDVRAQLCGAVLLDGGDVEGGQQVHGGHARLGELGQARGARRVRVADGGVGAADPLGQRLVAGGEVPQVHLVDGLVGELRDLGGGRVGPHLGRPARVVQVHEHRVCRVHGQAHGVRVGDDVGDDLVEGGHVHLDREGIGLTGPVLPALERPRAVLAAPHRVRPHGVRWVGRGLRRAVQLQGDGAGGRRPQREARRAVLPARTELLLRGGLGVERVEHAGDLQPGEHLESVRAVLGDDQLAAQRLLEHSALELGQVEGEVAGQVRAADELVLGEAAVPQGQLAEALPAGDLVAVGGDPAAGRGEQLPARRLRIGHEVRGPGDRVRVDEVGQLLAGVCGQRIGGLDGQLMGGRVVLEGHDLSVLGGEGVVGAVEHAVHAVVLRPRSPMGDLHLVGPAGQVLGGEGVDPVAVGVLHPGAHAPGHPVLGAAERGVHRAGEGEEGALGAVLHDVRDRVVPEGERPAVVGVGDVVAAGHTACAVVLVPAAADGDLEGVVAGGHVEGAGVLAGVGVQVQLGGGAVGLPVARAAHRRVVRSGQGHGLLIDLAGVPVLGTGRGEVRAHHRGDGVRHALAARVGGDGAVLDQGADGQVRHVVEDARGVVLGGAERGPRHLAGQSPAEGGLGPAVRGHGRGDRGAALDLPAVGQIQGDRLRVTGRGDGLIGHQHCGAERGDGELERAVGRSGHRGVVAVQR